MAIHNTNIKADTTLRDSLRSDMGNITDAFSGAVGEQQVPAAMMSNKASGTTRAGITADMVSKIKNAFETYIADINQAIDKIENPEVNQAFKGSAMEGAFKRLVNGVKITAQNFTNKLQESEMEIIKSVEQAYITQDSTMAQNINNDTGSLYS